MMSCDEIILDRKKGFDNLNGILTDLKIGEFMGSFRFLIGQNLDKDNGS